MQDKQTAGSRESGVRSQESCGPLRFSSSLRPAFTLTELLIVIAIMAVLAGLIAAAAVNAMRSANRGSIVLEIKNISGALENLKTDYGAYPPNAMNPSPTATAAGSPARLVPADMERFLRKAFPKHNEPDSLVNGLCGAATTAPAGYNLPLGMSAAEAMYFWLGGFSDDPVYPISGDGGPSFSDVSGDNDGNLEASDEILENRKIRYEFDLTRLAPRTDDGAFDQGGGRFLLYEVNLNGDGDTNDPGERRRINMWRYLPKGSDQPLVYFDVSRYKPHQYDPWAADPSSGAPYIFAMKQARSGVSGIPTNASEYRANIVFVDQGKFQILHAGLDDAWGNEFAQMSPTPPMGLNGWGLAEFGATIGKELIIYPDGPFIGEIADTLTSFTDGTLEDSVEE